MVIVPMMCALIISAFSKFNKVIKILAFVVAICLPIIPIASNYGLHYFGGYEPMLNNVTNVVFSFLASEKTGLPSSSCVDVTSRTSSRI